MNGDTITRKLERTRSCHIHPFPNGAPFFSIGPESVSLQKNIFSQATTTGTFAVLKGRYEFPNGVHCWQGRSDAVNYIIK